jgi:predicted aldo/keto reductase-like oxidoreductase
MVLSGMGNMDMMDDNLNTFGDFKPLSEDEFKLADRLRETIRKVRQIPCTACRYCTEVCPKNIDIPEIFSTYNKYLAAKITKSEAKNSLPDGARAGDCIKCGKCEKNCPQNIAIREHLEKVAKWK